MQYISQDLLCWLIPCLAAVACVWGAYLIWHLRIQSAIYQTQLDSLRPHLLTLKRRVFRIAQCAKKIRAQQHSNGTNLALWRERLEVECHITNATVHNLLSHFNCTEHDLINISGSKLGARLGLPFAQYEDFGDLIIATINWDLCTLDHLALGLIEEIGEFIWAVTKGQLSEQETLEEVGDILWYSRAILLRIVISSEPEQA